jgi:hypothetical protein
MAAGILVVAVLLIVTELAQPDALPSTPRSTAATNSAAAPAEVGYVSNGGTVAPAAVSPTAAAQPHPPELKVARTWTHVRKAPRPSAELEAVLTPGDTVLADSLQQGWYRVALDGEVLGYAYGTALAAADSAGSRGALTP